MIPRLSLLARLACLTGILSPNSQAQPSLAPVAREAQLRYLCSADGNVPAQVFGEWPQFKPGRRLAVETGSSAPILLAPSFLPLSSAGYQSVPLSPGKIVVQELPAEPADKSPPKTLASLNFQPKAGGFYTLLIRGTGPEIKLELLEDEPAVAAPSKEGKEPPPPRRGLRCVVLEPGARVKISCPEAGVNLQVGSEKPGMAENLRRGLWSLDLQGETKGQPFTTTIELDLESPGNWTLFFMKDIYGRVVPTLKKDASLD